MPALGLPTGTVERSFSKIPTLPIVNLVAERAITEPTQFRLVSRPKLQRYLSGAWGGTVPIRALLVTETASLGNYFAVFSSTFYNVSTPSSTALDEGSLVPSLAGNEIGVVATSGGDAKWYDGSAFRAISFPDSASVTKVLESQGRFIFLRRDSQRYYWTEPLANMLDGSGDMVIDGLAYASAEDEPDQLVDGIIWGGRLALGGAKTLELHSPSGDDNAPWQPILGSTVHKGVLNTGAMAIFDGSLVWAAPDGGIYRYPGGSGDKISNPGVEEALRGYDLCLDTFTANGKEYLHVYRVDQGVPLNLTGLTDFVLDATTNEWSEWETNGKVFDGGPSLDIGENYPLFGAKSDTRLLGMPEGSVSLPGGTWETTLEQRFAAGLPLDGGALTVHTISVRCTATPLDGAANDDTLSMRYTRDLGQSWSDWSTIHLQNNKIEWRSLGMFGPPGFLAQFKTANSLEFSVSGVSYNEFGAGRSW